MGAIALSISLAAVVFAVVDGVLFKPLPFPHAERLFHVQGSDGTPRGTASLSPAEARDLAGVDPRIAVTVYGSAPALTLRNQPDVTFRAAAVDARFFDVLGLQPLAGGFRPEHFTAVPDSTPGRDTALPALISYGFWRQQLGADLDAIGRSIDVVGSRVIVAGVLPADFVFPTAFGRIRPDALFPLTPRPEATIDRWSRSLTAIVRVDEVMAFEEATAKLSAALAAHAGEYTARAVRPGPYVGVSIRALPDYLGAAERPLFRLAFAGGLLLVVLGAINVAGLFAARGHDRLRELAVRAALGATRLDLVRLMLGEALIIALLGSAVGLALAEPLLTAARTLLPTTLLLMKTPAIDWRVVAFAIGVAASVVTALSFAPVAAMARRAAPQRALSDGAAVTPRFGSATRALLITMESAIGICLVVTGSLAVASFLVLRAADAGFDVDRLAVIDIRAADAATAGEMQARHAQTADRLRAMPGVTGVATIGVPVLENLFGGSQFTPPAGALRFPTSDVPISGAFFDVTGLRVLDGRVPSDVEIDAGRPVAVVSEATARHYWPSGRAVGQTLTSRQQTLTVVAVVEEARLGSQDDKDRGEIYLPAARSDSSSRVHLVRTSGNAATVARDAALALRRDVPGVLVRRAESFETALGQSTPLHRFRAILFGVSAAACLCLLAVGVGGLVATSVAGRVREMAIRSALGAQRDQLVRMMVADQIRPTVAGLALGLLASWWTTRLLRAWLYEIDVHEPAVWLVAVVCLLAVVSAAAWIPARRASAIDATIALRPE